MKNYQILFKIMTFVLSIVFISEIHAQTLDKNQLLEFNQKRHKINTVGMSILGTWAVGNIAVGSIAYYNTQGTTKYFHQGNAMWNVVNLGLAGFSLFVSMRENYGEWTFYDTFQEQNNLEKIFLFNTALDVAYVSTGFLLMQAAKNNAARHDQLKGYGQALILQGGFLFVFDLAMYIIHNKHSQPFFKAGMINF